MSKFLGKKQVESQGTSVSSIPIAPSDSALVIDLPEGQKLVLGKISEGTVIEVATWRGTGRPDSRTNRLMLGVSFGGTSDQTRDVEVDPTSNLIGFQLYLFRVKTLIKVVAKNAKLRFLALAAFLQKLLSKLAPIFRSLKKPRSKIAVDSPVVQDLDDEDFDVDKWLDSLRTTPRSKWSSGSRLLNESETSESKEVGRQKTPVRRGKRTSGGPRSTVANSKKRKDLKKR